MQYEQWKMSWPSYHLRRHSAQDRRLRPKDGSTSSNISCSDHWTDSLFAQDVLRDLKAHHQSEFVRLPTFKQIGGAIKILPGQRYEERDDASRIAAPGASRSEEHTSDSSPF